MELDINFHLVETPGPGGKPLLLLLFGPCVLNSLFVISHKETIKLQMVMEMAPNGTY